MRGSGQMWRSQVLDIILFDLLVDDPVMLDQYNRKRIISKSLAERLMCGIGPVWFILIT